MRTTILAGLTCALSLLTACLGEVGGSTEANQTTGGPGGDPTGETAATAGMSTTDGGTTATPTSTDPGSTTADPTGGGASKMEEYGHPCMTDADCVPVLGADGKCLKDILMVYELPGGYCSKLCMLPDPQTKYVEDAPDCGPGVTCIGADGYFEGCAIECTSNSECPREGYECRIMPTLGSDGDPKFCLMTDEHML